MPYLEIQYEIEGFGEDADLEKRYRLEDFLDEILRSENLGHVQGGSIGSGTMEVGCYVAELEKTVLMVSSRLEATEFADYLVIHKRED